MVGTEDRQRQLKTDPPEGKVVSSDGRNTSEIVRLCCRRLVV